MSNYEAIEYIKSGSIHKIPKLCPVEMFAFIVFELFLKFKFN